MIDENPFTGCENCGAEDDDRAMCFRGERWCSDSCRKAIAKLDKNRPAIEPRTMTAEEVIAAFDLEYPQKENHAT